jgi:GABA permease
MWFFPFLTYVTIIAICGILVSMAFIESMRDELLLTGFITGIVLLSYLVFRKRKVSEKASAKQVTQQQPDILP